MSRSVSRECQLILSKDKTKKIGSSLKTAVDPKCKQTISCVLPEKGGRGIG